MIPRLHTTLGAVLFLAWPAVVEQIMITLVQYVDTAMVGSLGSAATAAVGLTASTTWLFNGFLNAASVGFSVQVAQHLGAGRETEAKKVTWQALRFVGIFGAAIGLLALDVYKRQLLQPFPVRVLAHRLQDVPHGPFYFLHIHIALILSSGPAASGLSGQI